MYYVELEDGAYFTPNTSQDIILKEVKWKLKYPFLTYLERGI